MNIVALTGRLTRDPDVRINAESGNGVANFSLAVEGDRDSKGNKTADFIDCKAFNRTAELMQKYCGKGRQIAVAGSLHKESWETKDGEKRSKMIVYAARVDFLGNKAQDGESPYQEDPRNGFAKLDEEVPF